MKLVLSVFFIVIQSICFSQDQYSIRDLKNGKFGADFLVGALGAEYNQLEGELSGVNFYGELLLMTEIKTAKIVPTGAVGITYFY